MAFNAAGHVQVESEADLLSALENASPHIMITEKYTHAFIGDARLSADTDNLSGDSNSGGTTDLPGALFFDMMNAFNKGSQQQKQINKKLKRYDFKPLGDGELLLSRRTSDD